MPPNAAAPGRRRGLAALRRGGAVSDLLFLYECATREVAQLRSIAESLGLTVQAASHTFRGLARRGLVELANGRYRPTVAGVDFLHSTLTDVQGDLVARLERLHIVRTTRALARAPIAAGTPVVLSLEDGLLTARPGREGSSRGVARASARRGALVEVERLEGIVPLRPGPVRVLIVPEASVDAPSIVEALSAALEHRERGLVAALGLEAYHLTGRAAPDRSIVRFGIASAVEEATQLGIPCTVVVLDRDAPRLLTGFATSRSPQIEFVPIARRPARGRSTPR